MFAKRRAVRRARLPALGGAAEHRPRHARRRRLGAQGRPPARARAGRARLVCRDRRASGRTDAYLKDQFGLRQVAASRLHQSDEAACSASAAELCSSAATAGCSISARIWCGRARGLVVRDQRVPDAVEPCARRSRAAETEGDPLPGRRPAEHVRPSIRTICRSGRRTGAATTEYDLFLRASFGRAGSRRSICRPTVSAAASRRRGVLSARHPLDVARRDRRVQRRRRGRRPSRLADRPGVGARAPGCAQGRRSRRACSGSRTHDGARSNAHPASGRNGRATLLRSDAGCEITTGRPGPTVLMIGDSFTASYFPPLLAEHAGRAIWIHFQHCGFDWTAIDRYHPDEVWWVPDRAVALLRLKARGLGCPPDCR